MTPPIPRRSGVLHYVERWLPLSEQFVHGLVTRVARPGVVVSSGRLENVDLFPYERLVSLHRIRSPLPERLRRYVVTPTLMAYARRASVGIVHVHHGYRAYEVIGLSRRMGLPLVVSLHGHDVTGYLQARPAAYQHVIPAVDAAVVPSRYLADVAAAAGFPAERTHIIPSGVDTELFTPTPVPTSSHEVLFVGRFVEKKGLDTLLAAWPSVRDRVPEARLRLLGFGPLEHLARSAGDGVEVVVRPDQRTVRDAMRTAYLVVTPSRTATDDAVESLLIVNLEAQASGRPVVTTRHGAIPEFVAENETALVVPEADPRALAQALVTVLSDQSLASRMGERGPAVARTFDVRRCAARVDELYDALEAARRSRPDLGAR
ncbi:MAG: putative colanic acid biosynthesis glycosyl transferase [Acidimicrobiales bacterium]|nr:putative colanic acid biosynthesis glycosyl transferase [Acidimicrobiales bacterium]